MDHSFRVDLNRPLLFIFSFLIKNVLGDTLNLSNFEADIRHLLFYCGNFLQLDLNIVQALFDFVVQISDLKEFLGLQGGIEDRISLPLNLVRVTAFVDLLLPRILISLGDLILLRLFICINLDQSIGYSSRLLLLFSV